MRIIILSLALLFCAFSAHSQVLKSAGVWYFLDVDSMTARPAVLPNGTEIAYVVGTKTVYYWNRNTSTWTAYGSTFNRDSIYFDASIIGSGTVSDPWGVDSTLFATIAGVGDSIAAALVGYPSGSGTTNYIAKWATNTTLGLSNLFDNNTYAGVIARPWKFGEYTTAGLPTGVTGYTVYNTTTNGPAWYQGSRWAYALESTFARGTATRIPFFDANGQITENAFLTMLGATAAIKIPVGTTAQRPTVSTGLIRYNSETQSVEASNGTTFITIAQANNATGTFTSGFIPYGAGIGSRLNESSNFGYSGSDLQLISGKVTVNNSPSGSTILTGLDLARTAGAADPTVGSGIGIQFRRRESAGAFTADVLSHEIFAFSAGIVKSGYRFTVHNSTAGATTPTTSFLINGNAVSVPDGGFTVSNSTATPYVNITTTASSGNKEAGLYIKSRGDFGAVIEFDNASTSPGASAGGNILNFYNYKTANSGFTVVRMGGGNGNYGMDVVGQFTVRDSVDNLDRFQVNSGGTIIMNAYGTSATTAAALSKTESGYVAGFATDGTVTSLEIKRDTTIYVVDSDYDFSAALTTAQVSARHNRVIFLMTTTAAAGSDSELTLHTPDANLLQVEYLIHSVDEPAGFDNKIVFGTNNAVDSTNGLVTNYYPAAGDGIHIRAGLRSGVYKYRYSN